MGLLVKRDDFIHELSLASGIATSKSTMQILGSVLLKAGQGVLECIASDLRTEVASVIVAESTEQKLVAINAKRMFEIVRSLPENECKLEFGEGKLDIQSGKSRYKLVGYKGSEFPKINEIEDAKFHTVNSEMLSLLFKKVLFSTASDDTRAHLCGVFFNIEGGRMIVASTDGHRMTKAEQAIEFQMDLGDGIIVPKKGVGEIRKLLDRHKGECEIALYKHRFYVRSKNTIVSCKLFDGKQQFPDYKRVLPAEQKFHMTAVREKFLELLRRVSLMTNSVSAAVKFEIVPGKLIIKCENPDLGNVVDEVDIEYDGPNFVAGYNPKYLIDVVSEMDGERVLVDFDGELDPMVIKQKEGVPDDYMGIVMPLRL